MEREKDGLAGAGAGDELRRRAVLKKKLLLGLVCALLALMPM